MNISIVINTYINVDENLENPFDHPTSFAEFESKNTLRMTLESINHLDVGKDDNIKVVIFAIATQENCEFDNEIKTKVKNCCRGFQFEILVYTNSDINELNKSFNSKFLSTSGYSEIRSLGFVFPVIFDDDIIVQIDDDEEMRPEYISKMKEILNSNKDKYLFTAPYEKNGTVRITTEDDLESWKKFSSMADDMENFYYSTDQVKETLFGFGGNMVIRREFAEKIFYPLNVPRGEDFSMLLIARLIYENGNDYCGIDKKNELFRAYFTPYKEMTIIHKPPHEAKADFLKYFESNMKRFIMEWGTFIKQDNLTVEKLRKLSKYISEMIGCKNMEFRLNEIINEMKEKYSLSEVEKLYNRLITDVRFYMKEDRLEKYKKLQSEYIGFIKSVANDHWKNKIISIGKY